MAANAEARTNRARTPHPRNAFGMPQRGTLVGLQPHGGVAGTPFACALEKKEPRPAELARSAHVQNFKLFHLSQVHKERGLHPSGRFGIPF